MSVMRFVVLGAVGFAVGGALGGFSMFLPVPLPVSVLVSGAVGGASLGLASNDWKRVALLALLGAPRLTSVIKPRTLFSGGSASSAKLFAPRLL